MIRDEIDALLSTIGNETRVDKYRRNSLLTLRERFSPPATQLRVDIDGPVTATVVANLTAALQRATALAAKALLDPKNAAITVQAGLVDRAPLLPVAQSHGTLYFEFPETDIDRDAMERSPMAHLSENAVLELLGILPEDAGDDQALRALPLRRPQYRSAVKALAASLGPEASISLSMTPTGSTEREHSVLTAKQAREVPELLSGVQDKRDTLTVFGIMDGLRTRRRLFYIEERDSGHEYFGAIEDDAQLASVMEFVGQPVVARIERLVTLRADGTKSHPSYSLISVAPDQRLL
ncbi:hypothetical protein [Agromyces lapidis]|uniref:DUF4393 domain-containing protein n=1 Tax=Agromyces lapidis TaxID=279574 RepID=A0ABV5SUV4_9MICO|nr:hypothetical protein [Agromyces lapidis]